jgi:acetoin utilization deacetylase AcuC-like enzyme
MKWFYHPGYDYGWGLPDRPREVHGFVLDKPTRICERLVEKQVVSPSELRRPSPVLRHELRSVHDVELVSSLADPYAVACAIELSEIAELPAKMVWEAVVAPHLLAAGDTCEALQAAEDGEWAINLSGGYHHARRDLSHGFCLVNDVALAIERLRSRGIRRRILILDLDLHQGDGNATLFEDDEEVFTFSMHERDIFPFPKARSDIDIELPPQTGDGIYMAKLDDALAAIEARFHAEIVVYVAGSDPYEDDPLGNLQLSAETIAARDKRVARFAAWHQCSLVALPAGGYSPESPEITAAGFAEIAATERERRR